MYIQLNFSDAPAPSGNLSDELAARYFAAKNFWFLFLLLQLLVDLSSVLSFIVTATVAWRTTKDLLVLMFQPGTYLCWSAS